MSGTRSTTIFLLRRLIQSVLLFAFIAPALRADDAPPLPPPAAGPIDFATQIAPLLAEHCQMCHGADLEEGGFRLDRKSTALAGGNRGAAIVPGDSAASPLIRYVAGVDPDLTMPPDEVDRLTAEQVGLLRAWIDQGANWSDMEGAGNEPVRRASDHWAFQPVVRPEMPAVQASHWVRNPIDTFVLAKLEQEQVAPSHEADRATLIRRLSLDLTGLPPTTGEVDAFRLDNRPDAYERLVDHLLASPHYGERFARHWLDLARYADSDGYEKDLPRPYAWRYRHWVIDALNADLPFDEFTIEQLAGDLLPNPTTEQLVATGFHRNTLTNREGGVDQEEYRAKANVDRVATTGATWLGLTLGCAECHSHKYDPLSHREFYGLFAFFNESVEKDVPAPLATELAAYEAAKQAHDAEHAQLVQAIDAFEREQLAARQTAWEQSVEIPPAADWQVLAFDEALSEQGATFERLEDGSLIVGGESAATDSYTLTTPALPARTITALRLEALSDDRLPSRGPGRTKHGNFVLSELTVTLVAADGASATSPIALTNATADHSQSKFEVTQAADGDAKTGWAIGKREGASHTALFELAIPLDVPAGARLAIRLDQQHGDRHTLGRLRLSTTDVAPPVRIDRMPDEIAAILARPAAERSSDETNSLASYYQTIDLELAELKRTAAEHAAQAPQYPATQVPALAMNAKPPETHIHIRGDFLRPGAEVEPHTPAVLHPLHARGEHPDRLDLARWLVEPANPLTSRVTVNRAWHQLFGQPLVETLDDFGTRGERPTHPELLDWLATEFIARGWSQKQLHRLIVTSATYRQSSHVRDDLVDRDPKNQWLARQNRFRVEAEVVRDLSLATSGLLNRTIGGPSVRPPLPSGIAELGYAGSVKWEPSEGANRYRRGLYTFFQRTVPYPMLITFDAPDANVACTRRERSNTPLQALTLLNGVTSTEAAQAFARRIFTTCPDQDSSARARWALRTCLARDAEPAEISRLVQLHDELLALCTADPSAAQALSGAKDGDESASPAELAAWVAVSRTIMNLDQFVTRE